MEDITRVEKVLLHSMDLSSDKVIRLRESLTLMKVKDIKSIAKNLCIHVTAAIKKTELIDRTMVMAQIGAIRK